MITLVHFDMPYHLVKEYNGFASRYVVDCFERYAKVCIERFGDRVKHWMSFNEQNLHSYDVTCFLMLKLFLKELAIQNTYIK